MRKRTVRKRRATTGGIALLMKRSEQAEVKSILSRPLEGEEQHKLIIPARASAHCLMMGTAKIDDLHNVAAFMSVGVVLANDIGERQACDAIQEAIHHLADVKARGGSRYALNAKQRESIGQAVELTDELFCCSTLYEITVAHKKIMDALPMTGELQPVEIAVNVASSASRRA